jgi:hypothetical protein
MEETGEDRIVPPPMPSDVETHVSIWQRLKRLALKKLFLICLGIGAGLGIGVIATIASVVKPADPQENTPSEEDDTLTGFDYLNGHLETLSGNTFLVRTGEQDIAHTWNIKVHEGGAQPRLHITCKTKDYCVIENTTNNQAVHGKRIR